MILVINTSGKDLEFVLGDKYKSVAVEKQSVALPAETEKFITECGAKWSDINAIGVVVGPGSFTGIRAGITIARVLAQQTNIKLIGVPSSQILAKINKQATNTLVLTDARKNKVYLSLYNCNGNALMEPMLEDKEKITDYIKEQTQIISDKSIGEFLIELGFDSIQYEENDKDFGLYLSEICYKELIKKNNDYNWAKVKPLYIQQPSITRPKAVTNV